MTQPTNTFDSYDANGIRESLEDIIYDVSPEETPLYSACAKVKATNTFHEWQTDALRAENVLPGMGASRQNNIPRPHDQETESRSRATTILAYSD